MHDPHADAPRGQDAGWRDAFAALPAETPPADGWARVAAALEAAPRRDARARPWRRVAGGLALAATLALAVALPWRAADVDDAQPPAVAEATVEATVEAPADPLDALYAESARLEALLGHARDPRVGTGTAMAMTATLEDRLAAIDAALADPALPPERWEPLWRERVDALEALVAVEGTRRWLAANGEQYDGALVQVN